MKQLSPPISLLLLLLFFSPVSSVSLSLLLSLSHSRFASLTLETGEINVPDQT